MIWPVRLGAVAFVVLLAGSGIAAEEDAQARLVAAVKASGLHRAVARANTALNSGVAFHAGGGCWLTANHVADVASVGVAPLEGDPRTGQVRRREADANVALVMGPTPAAQFRISDRAPKPGEPVAIIGILGGALSPKSFQVASGRVLETGGGSGTLWGRGGEFVAQGGSPIVDASLHVVGMFVGLAKSQPPSVLGTRGAGLLKAAEGCASR